MSSLSITVHSGDVDTYIGRLVFDGREVHSDPQPGYEEAVDSILNDAAATRRGTFRKADGDAFLKAMGMRGNRDVSFDYEGEKREHGSIPKLVRHFVEGKS